MRRAISTFFGLVQTNEDIRKNYGRAVLDVNTNDLKLRPRDTLKTICRFLDTKCDDSYLDGIEYLFRTEILSKHRHLVKWTKDFNDLILVEMKKYSFLRPFLTWFKVMTSTRYQFTWPESELSHEFNVYIT